MKDWTLQAVNGSSRILAGESLSNLRLYPPENKTIVITDQNVRRLYGAQFSNYPVLEIGTGERIKNLETIDRLFTEFIRLGLDRTSFLVGIGGGIVCDITGFAASTFLRGIRFGFVPTTLLAQVDAAIGGKNGVNFLGYKNMIGVFRHPEFILIDPGVLKSLPALELQCGFAETVKHALIGSLELFEILEKRADSLSAGNTVDLPEIIERSVSIKAEIVERDALEQGERRKLNLGHTLGHAVEKVYGLPHGQAVGIGLTASAKISLFRELISHEDFVRIEALLQNLGLPTRLPGDFSRLKETLRKDKKRESEEIHFVLLDGIGRCIVSSLPIEEIYQYVQDMCQHC